MKTGELKDGQIVECRTGRAGRDKVEWDHDDLGNEWHEEYLYIARNPDGRLQTITLRGRFWAEGGMGDFSPDPEGGTFVVEDWYLQIRGLEE